jgi:hypothetical protein
MRKCTSTPALARLGEPAGAPGAASLDVFVGLRSFKNFYGDVWERLPAPVRDGVRDAGVAHFTAVFRAPDGSLTQFDFGPSDGGDIHLDARSPLARVLALSPLTRGAAAHPALGAHRRVNGAVREAPLAALPSAHMYAGGTALSLADVRAWNAARAAPAYELHRSDCRHYADALVRHATGLERATATTLRHQWARECERYGAPARALIRAGHVLTDYQNWNALRSAGRAATALAAGFAGRRVLAGVLPAAARAGPALAPPVRRALARRPAVAAGAAAAAASGIAASQCHAPGAAHEAASIGARMAGGVGCAVAAVADQLGRRAGVGAPQAGGHAVASFAGVVAAATRGAAAVMTAAPRAPLAVPRSVGSPARATLTGLHRAPSRRLALAARR